MTYDMVRRFFALYHRGVISRAALVEAIEEWQKGIKV